MTTKYKDRYVLGEGIVDITARQVGIIDPNSLQRIRLKRTPMHKWIDSTKQYRLVLEKVR